MAENALIATQDLTVCGDTIHRSVAAVDVRHLPQPTGSAAVSSRVRRPLASAVAEWLDRVTQESTPKKAQVRI